ncbi:MAG: multiheme c-type cytochrome [Bradymonadia bacterium]
MKTKTIFVAILLTALSTSCGSRTSPAKTPQASTPRLLVISSLIGYVEPCGCTVDLHLGGLARLAQIIEQERTKGPTLVVVVGPYLFEKQVKPHRVAQEKLKAELLVRSLKKMGVNAVLNTAIEDLFGETFRHEIGAHELPDINFETAAPGGVVIELGPLKIGLLGINAPLSEPNDKDSQAERLQRMQVAIDKMRAAKVDVVTAYSTLPRVNTKSLATALGGVDLWFLSHKAREETETQPLADGYLVEAGDRGRNVARIEFTSISGTKSWSDPKGEFARKRRDLQAQIRLNQFSLMRGGGQKNQTRLTNLKAQLASLKLEGQEGRQFTYTLLPVTKATPRAQPIAAWVDAYKGALKTLNLANAGQVKPVETGQSGYAGVEACRDCHPDAADFWDKTKHAKAWLTLEQAEKQYDAECVSCHVTGWQKPGGSILGKTKSLESVQCEVCHGPGSRHIDSGGDPELIALQAPNTLCVNCHNDHHSPKFNYPSYLKQITGPGHALRELP